MRVASVFSSNSQREVKRVLPRMLNYSFNAVTNSASYCSGSKITAQWGPPCNKCTAQLRYMDASQMSHTYGGSSLLLLRGVSCSVCGMWFIRDALTHVYICTLAHSHTLIVVGMINHGIFGSFRGGSENLFQLQRHFFLLPFIRHYYYRIHFCLSPLYYVIASSSHHLISQRWRRSHSPHVDGVTNPTFPQSASLTESSGDHIKHFPCFTLLLLLRFVFSRRVWIIVDVLCDSSQDR